MLPTSFLDANIISAAYQSSAEVDELKAKIEIISEILAGHEKRIAGQGNYQQDLEKQFERKGHDQTSLKGRIGKLEKEIEALEDKVDDAAVNDNRGRSLAKFGGSASEIGAMLVNDLTDVQARLTKLEIKVQELDGNVAALTTVVESGGPGHRAVPCRGLRRVLTSSRTRIARD